MERAYTSSIIAHLKALEHKEANTPKKSRRQEITKLRAEINHIKTKNHKESKQKTNKQKQQQQQQT